jgi:hypothetical protein
VTAFTYIVPSDEKYEVDISVGICMCEAGKHGKFCKHQAGILKFSYFFHQMHLELLLKQGTGQQLWHLVLKQNLCHFTNH